MLGTVGEMRVFAGNFAPHNWAFCDGQVMSVNANPNLFSIIGNTFGGNGVTTYNLPDLRGRVIVSPGQGLGLRDYFRGEKGGVETVSLGITEIPAHNHTATFAQTSGTSSTPAVATAGNTDSPENAVLAQGAAGSNGYSSNAGTTDLKAGTATVEGTVTVENTGGSQPHTNLQPFLSIQWIICVDGEYPGRN